MNLKLINKKYSDNQKEDIYKIISDIFVAKEDMITIHNFCINNKAKVTFREAGIASISQLKRGAGAKPHSILEKSIKESRMTPVDIQALKSIVGESNLELVLGLVGRWSKQPTQGNQVNKTLKGLYLTNKANGAINGELKLFAPIIKPPNPYKNGVRKNYFIKLALSQSHASNMINKAKTRVEKLKNPKEIEFEKGPYFKIAPYYVSYRLSTIFLKTLVSEKGKKFYKYLFAGDYDMHDLFTNRAFAQGSFDEKRLINNLNSQINSSGHRKQAFANFLKDNSSSSDYNMIQHGAQEKYSANMANNEKGKPIDQVVAQMSKDALAACSPDGWEMIKGFDQLSEFYERYGLKSKQKWRPPSSEEKSREKKDPLPTVQKAIEEKRKKEALNQHKNRRRQSFS